MSLTTDSDFCRLCGAKVIRNRLTFKNLFENFTETFFNYDNRFLQTFITLFTKPEKVITSYISGTRKKYVNVISYYAIAITVSGLYYYFLNNFFPDTLDFSSLTTKGQEEMSKTIFNWIQEYQSIAMMLNVPIYAIVSRIVFIKEKTRNYNYTEHLVIFMYILAQLSIVGAIFFIISAFFGLNMGDMSLYFGPLQVLYSLYCLQRIFKLTAPQLLFRTLIFIVVIGISMLIFSAIFLGSMYFSGNLEAFIEAQKATKSS